jgi:hypothetical protein
MIELSNFNKSLLENRVSDLINGIQEDEKLRFFFNDNSSIDVTKAGESFAAKKLVNDQPEVIIIGTVNQVSATIIKTDGIGPVVAKDLQQWVHPLLDENLKSVLMKSKGVPSENLQGKLDQTVLKYRLTKDGTLDYMAKDQINIHSIQLKNAPYLNQQNKSIMLDVAAGKVKLMPNMSLNQQI